MAPEKPDNNGMLLSSSISSTDYDRIEIEYSFDSYPNPILLKETRNPFNQDIIYLIKTSFDTNNMSEWSNKLRICDNLCLVFSRNVNGAGIVQKFIITVIPMNAAT